MRTLVTGANGYAGSHAVADLRQRGAARIALVRCAAAAERAESAGLEPLRAALEDPATLLPAVPCVDGVGHFAASESPAFQTVNRRAVDVILGGLAPGRAFVT